MIIVSSILTPLLLKTLYKKYPHTELPELGGSVAVADAANGELSETNDDPQDEGKSVSDSVDTSDVAKTQEVNAAEAADNK